MQPPTSRIRAEPADGPAALVRRAADLYGAEALAGALEVSARSLYRWISGERALPPRLLGQVRLLLIRRRQHIAELVQDFRDEEGLNDADR